MYERRVVEILIFNLSLLCAYGYFFATEPKNLFLNTRKHWRGYIDKLFLLNWTCRLKHRKLLKLAFDFNH